MAQRVAIALARQPKLIIADERTAALDASVKRTVIDLLVRACYAAGSALLLVTHDLHAVRQYTGSVAAMYGGRVIERSMTADVLEHPVHPYTRALMGAASGPRTGRAHPWHANSAHGPRGVLRVPACVRRASLTP